MKSKLYFAYNIHKRRTRNNKPDYKTFVNVAEQYGGDAQQIEGIKVHYKRY